ncbi:MAG: hypothetical protein IK025_04590 [Bacteroidales bacterium]|nr:hypothetical protein [Bacteroidales bacterium]
MKKNFILAVFCLIISAMTFAQVPQKMSYQAVVRGSDNNLVTNSEISVRISILQGSTDGEAVYTETHSATTNANGLVTIEIGDGTSSDDISAINWANGPYFVKTETDVNGGYNYDIIGVSQLLSVPYAIYAQTAGNVPDVSSFLTEETDPTVSEWAKAENKPVYDYSEITNTPEIPTVPTNVSAFENDANYLISYTETDPTVPSWAMAETKPVYDYSEINNTPEIPTIPTIVSAFENDANYLTSYTEADPTVPAWAKAETKPTYDYSEINNTPEIPTIPTNVTAFENDANYLTSYTETQNIADVAALGNLVNTQLKNVTDPTENQDAATKKYVDELVSQLQAAIDVLNARVTTGRTNGHDWVDLGLPSGTRWATCNVGAVIPEDNGNYFAWGYTTANNGTSWGSYCFCNGSERTLTKYCNDASFGNNGYTDSLTILEPSDDAATINWGEEWRMPTYDEFNELINNCTIIFRTQNSKSGYLLIGPNGNSIFMPYAGNYGIPNAGFSYWSSSIHTNYPNNAWSLTSSSTLNMSWGSRASGYSIRPICATTQN